MAKIIPYRPFFYSQPYRERLGQLVSPPYDVISPEALLKLKAQDAHNSVHLCLSDEPQNPRRYENMGERFRGWKNESVFETYSKPAFCLIEERFVKFGVERQRIGFTGLIESTPFAEGHVLPHEHTLSGPKADRLELLRSMGAELSQVFFCYKDFTHTLENLFSIYQKQPPYLTATDPGGVSRRLWLIDDVSDIAKLQNLMDDKSVLIADGHHRYETSVHFRELDNKPRSRYVQGYFTNLDSPGFSILPIHRIFSLPESVSPDSFRRKLATIFEMKSFGPGLDLSALEALRTSNRLALLCAFQDTLDIFSLSMKKASLDEAEIFSIHKNIFEELLMWDVLKLAKGVIHYEHETEAFKATLKQTSRGVGLFLPPTDLNLVMKLAERGERMPQKSTFFYPKLASGFVNYELGSF